MSHLATFVAMFLGLAVVCFYFTMGWVRALVGRGGSVALAAAISFACWCVADVALAEFGPMLFGAGAEVDLFDFDMAGFEVPTAAKFALYAFAHVLAAVPRLWQSPKLEHP